MIINGELEIPKYKLYGIKENWPSPRFFTCENDIDKIKETMNNIFNIIVNMNFTERCTLEILDENNNIIDSKSYPDDVV